MPTTLRLALLVRLLVVTGAFAPHDTDPETVHRGSAVKKLANTKG